MKNSTTKWLWRVTGKKKWYVALLILAQGINGGSGVLYALLLQQMVDRAVGHDRNGFLLFAGLLLLLVAGQVAIRGLIRWLEELSRATLENLFKSRLFHHLLYKDYASVNAVHSGEWLNRLTNDTALVANSCVAILPGLAGMCVKLVSALTMILIYDVRFAAMLVPCGAILILFTYAFRRVIKRLHRNTQEKDGKLRIFLQEHLGCMMMLRSFAAEPQAEEAAAEKMQAHKAARLRKNRFSNFCNIGFGAAMNGMYVLGACYCGYGILTDTMSYGTLVGITQLIAQIQQPFANITGYFPQFFAMLSSAERLMEVEQFADESTEPPYSLAHVQQFYEQSLCSVVLEHVDYTYYPASQELSNLEKKNIPVVLKDVSLSIQKGDYVAVTGHSGCGKSTLLKLLMCLYHPDSGRLFLQDTDGTQHPMDARWHRLFAYVPQGNQLMSGTIREAVTFASGGAFQEEKFRRALQIACADEFVDKLEHGMDTPLGENGTGLSEGQMQRLAVARAIYADSPILLLDESTSSLDVPTERKLLENLKAMTDKTVIIVTHRGQVLSICDREIQMTEHGICWKTLHDGVPISES